MKWWKRGKWKFWVETEKEMKTRPENKVETDPKSIGEKTEGGKTFFGIKWTFKW